MTAEQRDQLERGDVLLEWLEPLQGSGVAVRAVGVVEAPPARVWPVLRDCEKYEQFLPGVSSSKLAGRVRLDGRDATEARCLVEISLPFPLGTWRSDMRVVESTLPGGGFERRWNLVRGTYAHNDGSWALLPWGADGERTLAVYQVDIDPDTFVPDFILRRTQKSTVPEVFEAVRKRVRSRPRPDDGGSP